MDITEKTHEQKRKIKNQVLLAVNAAMFVIVLLFWSSEGAIIDTIFTIAGYTYGPLLGLFLTGLFSKWELHERWTPLACIMAAGCTWLLHSYCLAAYRFDFGFMNIFVNASLTIFFLYVIKRINYEHCFVRIKS
jgi:hypothetical protein